MLIRRVLRVFFNLLYHPLAFTYDTVAAIVSLGRWNDWVFSILPFIDSRFVLELGHGPGHLQRILRDRQIATVGLDESASMGRLAKTRLRKGGYGNINLTRGLSQKLPFPDKAFSTIVSTFPSEYIFDGHTLAEARRCLLDDGRLVVLPVAWHIGRRIIERYLAWLFRVTGESPALDELIFDKMIRPFEKTGFLVETHKVEVKSSLLFIMIATRSRSETADVEKTS